MLSPRFPACRRSSTIARGPRSLRANARTIWIFRAME
jgi:hypothetical protein